MNRSSSPRKNPTSVNTYPSAALSSSSPLENNNRTLASSSSSSSLSRRKRWRGLFMLQFGVLLGIVACIAQQGMLNRQVLQTLYATGTTEVVSGGSAEMMLLSSEWAVDMLSNLRNTSDYYFSSISNNNDAKTTSANEKLLPVWERNDTKLPDWMKTYFQWHSETRRNLNATNWKSTKFALSACLNSYVKCGGASDRLQSLPWDVMMAARNQRLLLVKWERPWALEEFLEPPAFGGVDWTVPDWLWDDMSQVMMADGYSTLDSCNDKRVGAAMRSQHILLFLRLQSSDHGAIYYNEQVRITNDETYNSSLHNTVHQGSGIQPLIIPKNESNFYQVFSDVWEAFYAPVPAVQSIITQSQTELQLQPREYIGAHVRQKYVRDTSHDLEKVENHVRCAYRQRPDIPIYFASDSKPAMEHAVKYGQEQQQLSFLDTANVSSPAVHQRRRIIRVVARTNSTEPLHLDRGSDFLQAGGAQQTDPADYYDVFVDLYLLAQAKCVVYGLGGYGQWASLFTLEPCSYRQKGSDGLCDWDSPARIFNSS